MKRNLLILSMVVLSCVSQSVRASEKVRGEDEKTTTDISAAQERARKEGLSYWEFRLNFEDLTTIESIDAVAQPNGWYLWGYSAIFPKGRIKVKTLTKAGEKPQYTGKCYLDGHKPLVLPLEQVEALFKHMDKVCRAQSTTSHFGAH